MKLSIIIPAYNEKDNIADVINKIENSIDIPFELIVVNDHSVDNTVRLIEKLTQQYSNIRLVENKSDRGFANAIKTGFNNATGDVFIPIMADLCDDLSTVKKMFDKINEGYDIVCASRYIKGGARIGGSGVKGFFSCFVGWSLHFLLGIPTHDIANAFKMYRKKVIDSMDIKSKSFEISMEIPLKAYYLGFKLTEIPTVWQERTKGKSTFKIFKMLPNYLKLYIWAIFMRFKKNKTILLLAIIFILAFTLRIYHLSFFEFKSDQLYAISAGNDTRRAHFLITHGITSGVGINNPPLFLWFMGIVTFFTNSPFYITAIFMLANTVALALAICYFYISLPKVYAILSSVLLAFSPAFTTYANIIWAQSLLPFLMVLFHIALYKFVKEDKKTHYFIFIGILATLASQLHMSGFSLFPLLIILAIFYRNKINKKIFTILTSFVFVTFLPYLYHLFYEKELGKFTSYFNLIMHKSIYWKLFREHLRMASFDFFRHYFKNDFSDVLDKSVGVFRFILYPLACILIALFAISLTYYLIWLIKGRKLFNKTEEALKEHPLPFQISGFMLLFITLGYLVFRVRTPPHYFIILFPSYSLLTGFVAYKIWKIFLLKVIVSLSILSTVILLAGVFLFLRRAGGHPHEYGPNYQTLLGWARDIRSIVPKGYCPSLSISCLGQGKCDTNAISAIVVGNYKCNNNALAIPLRLTISWDERLMHYEYSLNIEN